MSDTTQNAAQKAFEFADKLHFAFPKGQKAENVELKSGSCQFNYIILDCLGREKYFKFCHNMRVTYHLRAADFKNDPFFKEGFVENPVTDDNILFDNEVLFYWKLSEIMAEVKKLL